MPARDGRIGPVRQVSSGARRRQPTRRLQEDSPARSTSGGSGRSPMAVRVHPGRKPVQVICAARLERLDRSADPPRHGPAGHGGSCRSPRQSEGRLAARLVSRSASSGSLIPAGCSARRRLPAPFDPVGQVAERPWWPPGSSPARRRGNSASLATFRGREHRRAHAGTRGR